MKASMQTIFACATFLGLSMAAPAPQSAPNNAVAQSGNTSTSGGEPSLPMPPAAPHQIQNGNYFLRVTNYTSDPISSYALIPCFLTLGQTAIAHVDAKESLSDPIPVPHGFECTSDKVNLIVNEDPLMTYDDLNQLSYLLVQWQQAYTFKGISFEFGMGSKVYTTGQVSTAKLGDSG